MAQISSRWNDLLERLLASTVFLQPEGPNTQYLKSLVLQYWVPGPSGTATVLSLGDPLDEERQM